MPRAKTDKTICRYCRQREPLVKINLTKGLPNGECQECNTKRCLDLRRRKRFALGLYSDTPELVSAVLKTLAGLGLGAYPLISNVSKLRIGFIVVQDGAFYVDTWGQCHRFHYRLYETASYLGNQGLFIDSKPIPVLSPEGQSLPPEEIGLSTPLENPGDTLLWLNPALQQHALRLMREEIRTAKVQNLAKGRRSNNPNRNTVPKGAE